MEHPLAAAEQPSEVARILRGGGHRRGAPSLSGCACTQAGKWASSGRVHAHVRKNKEYWREAKCLMKDQLQVHFATLGPALELVSPASLCVVVAKPRFPPMRNLVDPAPRG